MSLSAKETPERVGGTKPGFLKAIRQGKLSATKDHNGEWRIDPAELFRVYPRIYRARVHTGSDPPGGPAPTHKPKER
jgi:hypothetical protein